MCWLPAESHGQRNLAGYSPWGYKESDPTKKLTHTHTHTCARTHTHTCVCTHTHTHTRSYNKPRAMGNHEECARRTLGTSALH